MLHSYNKIVFYFVYKMYTNSIVYSKIVLSLPFWQFPYSGFIWVKFKMSYSSLHSPVAHLQVYS